MTLEDVLKALSACSAPAASDCVRSVHTKVVSAAFPPIGRITVGEALVLFEHRRATMVAAGIAFDGLVELLADLALRDAHEQLALAGFSGKRESFVAFLDAEANVIGCIRIGKGVDRSS